MLGWRSVKSRVRGVKAGDAPEAACVGPKSGPIAPREEALRSNPHCSNSSAAARAPPRLSTPLAGKLLGVEQDQICSALRVETGALVVIQK